MQRLYKGNTNLYYLSNGSLKSYFIEKDSSDLVEISKRDKNEKAYKNQLSDILNDCNDVSEVLKYVNYTKKSITKLISIYDVCELKDFPHFRYGLSLGYGLNKFFPTKTLKMNQLTLLILDI